MSRRLIDKDRVREQRRQERLLLILERKFTPLFKAEIKRASAEMIKEFAKTGAAPNLPDDHAIRLGYIYKQLSVLTFEVFGERILDQGKSAGLVVETKDFAEFFQRVALDYIASEAIRTRITSVSASTRSQIVDLVIMGQESGFSVINIAQNIARTIPSIALQRAVLIARTETHGAANVGADQAARQLGLELRKEWVAAKDERTRLAHAEADGQVVDMDQPFDVDGEKLMFAGDPNGSAGNTINCRCAVSHIVVE